MWPPSPHPNPRLTKPTLRTVIIFTLALFLSGYAIQQRTLHDLRAAIAPHPPPDPYPVIAVLPDRFRRSTTELPDGTVVALDEDARLSYRPPAAEAAADKGAAADARAPAHQQGPGGVAGRERPLGAAERRRRIKEEIVRLARGQERGYYQRRLW